MLTMKARWALAGFLSLCLTLTSGDDSDGYVTIVANRVQPSGASVHTVAQLQALLDAHTGVFHVRNTAGS